ncbi:MAG: porin family protein [Muribaculaceae bacterium]|nr:porin family protein [Muribaculaceae bacterium]
MRKTITLFLALITALSALADGLWGAKASFDINKPGKWKTGDVSTTLYTSGLGFSVGGVYSHYFNDNLFLEPSLSIFYDTYGCDFIIAEGMTADYSPKVYKAGLRIPVVIGYTFDITDDFAVAVFTGPEFDYAFAGDYRWKNKSIQDMAGDLHLFGKESGMDRRLSCAWKGGIGFPFSDWRVDFEAAVGISDIVVGAPSCRQNRFSLSLLRYF